MKPVITITKLDLTQSLRRFLGVPGKTATILRSAKTKREAISSRSKTSRISEPRR